MKNKIYNPYGEYEKDFEKLTAPAKEKLKKEEQQEKNNEILKNFEQYFVGIDKVLDRLKSKFLFDENGVAIKNRNNIVILNYLDYLFKLKSEMETIQNDTEIATVLSTTSYLLIDVNKCIEEVDSILTTIPLITKNTNSSMRKLYKSMNRLQKGMGRTGVTRSRFSSGRKNAPQGGLSKKEEKTFDQRFKNLSMETKAFLDVRTPTSETKPDNKSNGTSKGDLGLSPAETMKGAK